MSIAATNWAFSIIAKHKLTASERLVLLALAHREHTKTRRCDPSAATLATMTGMSRPKVYEAIGRLVDMGVISATNRTRGKAVISNSYRLGGDPSAEQGGGPSAEQAPCYDGAIGGVVPQRNRGGGPSAEHNRGSLYRGPSIVTLPTRRAASGEGRS